MRPAMWLKGLCSACAGLVACNVVLGLDDRPAKGPGGDVGGAGGVAGSGGGGGGDGGGAGTVGELRWLKSFGGKGDDSAYGISAHPSGSLSVVGTFELTAEFETASLQAIDTDAFVLSLALDGQLRWLEQVGAAAGGQQRAFGVAIDSSGRTYFCGSYVGELDIGELSAGVMWAHENGYISRLDSMGDAGLLVQPAGPADNLARDVAVRSTTGVVLVGLFHESIDIASVPLTSGGERDSYVSHLFTSGQEWVTHLTSTGPVTATGVALDERDDVFTVGMFSDELTAGSSPPMTSAGSADAFVLKLDGATGSWAWSLPFGGADMDFANDVAVDSVGSVLVTGAFHGSATFGPELRQSNGSSDVFVAKIDGDGVFSWVFTFGGESTDVAMGLAIDSQDHVWVVGVARAQLSIGDESFEAADDGDLFVVELSPTGAVLDAAMYGGTGLQQGNGIAVSAEDELFIVGANAGTLTVGTTAVQSVGGADIFALSIRPPLP